MTYPQRKGLLDFVTFTTLIDNLTQSPLIACITMCYKIKEDFLICYFFVSPAVDKLWIRVELTADFTLG